MKTAIIKTNYSTGYGDENLKGHEFKIVEEFDRFVALDIEGRTVDFARSEVEIIDNPDDDETGNLDLSAIHK